ncbi:hypothetical protein PVK06_027712 [Gossypium arboreum]|uniref:Uncharacterized protein n=1 Tax=Gossypium arboreum TaxID=29729 RepID=A0ABR0P104_GOSAR|nr:hypothetical protein PVK06_027712 [Gossypium arboreum]
MVSSQSLWIKVLLSRVKVLVAILRVSRRLEVLSKASPLYGFGNHPVKVKGSITLPVTLGDGEHTTTEYVQFFVMNHPMAYNAIFERLIMRMENMVVATFCINVKFPTRIGVGFMRSNQRTARQCYMLSVR